MFAEMNPEIAARVLSAMKVYPEAIEIIKKHTLHLRDSLYLRLLAEALFELGRVEEVIDCAKLFPKTTLTFDPHSMKMLAHIELLAGHEAIAADLLESVALIQSEFWRPHQNLSARDQWDYKPTIIDRLSGKTGLLYDAYNYMGQRVEHIGRGELSRDLYAGAMHMQTKLRQSELPISKKCRTFLSGLGIDLEDLKILPAEWSTQIGHQGMLDILFRMRDLGWWKGKAVLLAPGDRTANHAFLSLFAEQTHILIAGVNVDPEVERELGSLQRLYGLNFKAFRFPSGEVSLWQEAGALLMRQWEAEGRGHPLRDTFERLMLSAPLVEESVQRVKSEWGMGPNDWYVCLHMRDASHYAEMAGTGQVHRNTDIQNYMMAIRHITDQGGWVVKLGGPRSPKLPKMPRVVDYARGDFRSEMLDLYLIRNARYFIGTTSGLTNVAVSFGVPSALVSCITTDAQLWGDRVRFAFKSVRLVDGRLITQRELTSTPWRWRVFSADVMAYNGAVFVDNTPDEILEIVKEVESLANGDERKYASTIPDSDALMDRWVASLALPHFYGNAKPSLYFLQKHANEFLGGP